MELLFYGSNYYLKNHYKDGKLKAEENTQPLIFCEENVMKKTTIGGEALIEGVMMKGPENIAIAVRKSDGEIVIEKQIYVSIAKRYSILKLPVLRGAVGIIESMIIGVKSLMYSADLVDFEEETQEKPSKIDAFLERVFGDKLKDVAIGFSVFVALVLGIGLFMILPYLLAIPLNLDRSKAAGNIMYNLFEGAIRIILFFGYIILISKMKDIQRVFQYHGAEHKTIHCYEHEEELTVENVRKYTTRHPRCGTAFMFVIMIISIIVFSFIKSEVVLVNILARLLFIPLIAGLSYEVIRFAGRTDWKIMRLISVPGLALQRFTTIEPDDSQIEVAIEALKNVLVDDEEADKW